jgi:uncharacterized protein (DUF697 family)
MTKKEAEEKARSVVNAWSMGAVAVGWLPGSSFILGANEYVMVGQVADCFQVRNYDAEAVMTVLTATIGGRMAVELLSFIPILGWAVKAGVAASVTKAVGEAVIAHFRNLSNLPEG